MPNTAGPKSDAPDTRSALVLAGVAALETDGIDALGLRAIARRAGVSHGAPRRYFPTHRSLVAAIARSGLDDLAAEVQAALDHPVAPEQRLVAAGCVYVDFARRRRAMFELIHRHDLLDGAGGELRAVSLPMLARLRASIDIATGATAEDWTETVSLWTAIHGIAVLHGNLALDVLGDECAAPAQLVARAVKAALDAP